MMTRGIVAMLERRPARAGWPTAWTLSAALMLGGCAGIDSAPTRFATSKTALDDADAYFADVLKSYGSANDVQRKALRDAFIETRAALIDQAYAAFRQSLYSQRVGLDVGVDVATLGLNAAGVITGSEQAKTTLHALSGGLIGSKASIDKNMFFDRTLPAMLAQMEAQRGAVRLRLLSGMMVGTDRYPLMQARADIEEYFVAGTVVGAIGGITNQALTEQKNSTEALAARLPTRQQIGERLEGLGFNVESGANDDSSRDLLNCWQSQDPTARTANQAAIRQWVADQRLPFVSPPSAIFIFLNDPGQTANRARAIGDAALKSRLAACALATR